MDIKHAISQVTQEQDLSRDEMIVVMQALMSGDASNAQIAAFLVGLQMKGITVDELYGGATVMRQLATPVVVENKTNLVDTCGTGGSGSNKFNVSTASAVVAASAGARVAKHGNRSATSKSGSADLLEAAGVNLALDASAVAQCINQLGIGFMFAPVHHSAMKHVISARKEIGVRTLFNLLGPLTNPAASPNQIIGVYDKKWIPVLLEVLRDLGSEHVLVVSSDDGLDEISASAPTTVGELKDSRVTMYTVEPETFGFERQSGFKHLQIASAQESLALVKAALTYTDQQAADIVALNAGAAIYAANVTDSLVDGVKLAVQTLHSGKAIDLLAKLSSFSNELASN
ncbi:MAG: anthranilate phosphoribosyltransferase [Pseudohongiellaceae bacterium]|jgi:anthranilate phosphoribosyltransferase